MALDDMILTAEKVRSINFTERKNNFFSSLHYNRASRYVFANAVVKSMLLVLV